MADLQETETGPDNTSPGLLLNCPDLVYKNTGKKADKWEQQKRVGFVKGDPRAGRPKGSLGARTHLMRAGGKKLDAETAKILIEKSKIDSVYFKIFIEYLWGKPSLPIEHMGTVSIAQLIIDAEKALDSI